ncbi:unnamed protein product [Linum trigynum]|uniref:Cytochrome P450 n=1 Tax=Linum trigynum TaxID=586398 RepID=A0AAV2GN77_9ROSI
MDSLPIITLAISFLCLSFYILADSRRRRRRSDKQTRFPPEPANPWPIIGHLPVMAGRELPHRALAALADKYGPVFTLRLGINRVLIVSSPEIAKELFTTKDTVALSRPAITATKVFSYDYAVFGMGPHGDYWRETRKISVLELLSARRLELLRHFRESEVQKSINELYNQIGRDPEIDLKKWIGDLSLNLMLKLVAGKSSSVSDSVSFVGFKNCVRELFKYGGTFVVGDALPFLRWMDIGGHEKKMKMVAREMDGYLQQWLDEHKENRGEKKTELDFIDVLLSLLDGQSLHGYDSDTIIKAMSLSMISGGTDTTNVSVVWAMALLLNNRDVLLKAQTELNDVVPRDRSVTEADIGKLVYLQAVVKEAMRMYPAAPLLAAREFITDCHVGGYEVRKGTWLMVNAWRIQNDPAVWPDPTRFDPERFLTSEIDVKGHHFELFPFGSGRRACPGMNLGLQMVHLSLASFLHAFDFKTVGGEAVDMAESFGMTNMMVAPLKVVASPRLSRDVYA